ncbi:jg19992 [Pararge aegeria aegeria]|uniref:Jg19992 protein n=1 Tax=Pararge aegeria aegeria TaxID=348720 RepID=A0A8S4R4M4_9NEOP|nr:jg19992 [Pararge aegeria aegeria]
MIIKSFVLVMLSCLVVLSESARILAVLPVPMISHQMVFRVLMQELAKRGHHVTMITGIPSNSKDQMTANYTEIDVSPVTDSVRTKLLTEEIKISDDLLPQFLSTFKITVDINDKLLGLEVIKTMIRDTESTHFDLIFLEDCLKSSLIFSHFFKAPVIHISSFGGTFETFEAVGAATHPFFYPLAVRKRYHDLSMLEKISELHLQYRLQKAYNEHEELDNRVFQKHFGKNAPTLDELKKNIHLVFLNIHRIWDSNRPVPPNVIYLGGLHEKPQQELPKELKSSLDSSDKGIIYVSFGTNINPAILSPERLQTFIKVFSKLPYDIYWKWNDNLPGLTENIKIFKWFPQSDLLRHPKVKLFITQGGLQSTDEAIVGGVPLIGIPMMWDQWYNVNKYVQFNIGLQLDINTLTESNLKDAIETVIQDKSFKENIIKLHSVIHDQLQSPLERAVWWTEYVIRNHGAEHLLISKSAKILAVLPVPVLSHQMVFRVLTQELAQRGHQVTVITGIPIYARDIAPVNYTEISIRGISENIMEQLMTEEINISEDLVAQFVSTFKASSQIYDELLGLEDIQNLIKYKSTYFDLIFLEDCAKATLIFSHLFNAPVIQISSFGGTFETFEAVGASTHPFLYPLAIRKRYHNLSAWEKISELFLQYRLQKVYNEAEMMDSEILKKHFGRNTPTVHELKKNIHMLFLNIHPIWDSNRPVPPNVIYLGGLHQKPQQVLLKDLKSSLDSATEGIIYVSFGTNVNPAILPLEKLQIFINVFSKLPYDVYWKWNDKDLPILSKNIKIYKWFPQSDLLRHPKVKLFITQGGLQSTDEAIAAGVPLIGIPIVWDQWFNVDKYVHLGIGLQLDINTITETKLKDAIETILGDKRYKENILRLHSVMRDQVQSPLARAIWWTEYVIRNRGAEHLRAPTAHITWIEYYEIKLMLFIGTFTILMLVILSLTFLRILRLFVNKIKTD